MKRRTKKNSLTKKRNKYDGFLPVSIPMKMINTSLYAEFGKYKKRKKMVRLLSHYGIRDKRVLNAFMTVPRHIFCTESQQASAYSDMPLHIGYGQTISQPYVVALMLEKLKLCQRDRILEIGSGSGYVLALLSCLVNSVVGVELEKELADRSKRTLAKLNMKSVRVVCGDGYVGWEKGAPYDAILLSAAPPKVPRYLLNQLKSRGKLILPVGKRTQLLVLYTQINGEWKGQTLTDVRFVPLRKKNASKS